MEIFNANNVQLNVSNVKEPLQIVHHVNKIRGLIKNSKYLII
jgi:hypothetical protein